MAVKSKQANLVYNQIHFHRGFDKSSHIHSKLIIDSGFLQDLTFIVNNYTTDLTFIVNNYTADYTFDIDNLFPFRQGLIIIHIQSKLITDLYSHALHKLSPG